MATLIGINTQKYDIGRAAIFRQPVWTGTTDLFPDFVHIGNTEGEITIETNEEYSELTLPETSGPASLKKFLTGSKPTFEFGMFPTSEANLQLFGPTSKGSLGQHRRRAVQEHTLWIVPEELFLKPDASGNTTEVAVTFLTGAWLKDGQALTVEEQRLRDLSLILWRADFSKSTPMYRHEDGGKALRQVTISLQQDFAKPQGCQLYLLVGEMADFPTIDFEPE